MAILSRNFHIMNAYNFKENFKKDKLYIAIGNPNSWTGNQVSEINPPNVTIGSYIAKEDIIAIAPVLSYDLVYPVDGLDLNTSDNYVSYADQVYKKLDSLPEDTTLENINDRISTDIYPHFVYTDFVFGYTEVNKLFDPIYSSYAFPWKIEWKDNTDIKTEHSYEIRIGFLSSSIFAVTVKDLFTKKIIEEKEITLTSTSNFETISTAMNKTVEQGGSKYLKLTKHNTEASSNIPYYANLTDFKFYNIPTDYNYYFDVALGNMEQAIEQNLNTTTSTIPTAPFSFPWTVKWKTGKPSTSEKSMVFKLKIGYSNVAKTEAKWILTKGGVKAADGTITSTNNKALTLQDIADKISNSNTNSYITLEIAHTKIATYRECNPILINGFNSYEYAGHSGVSEYNYYYSTAISGMKKAQFKKVYKAGSTNNTSSSSSETTFNFPWTVNWKEGKPNRTETVYGLKVGYTNFNKTAAKYFFGYLNNSSEYTQLEEKEITSESALTINDLAMKISELSEYIILSRIEDINPSIPISYRSAVLLYNPTFAADSYEVGKQIYKQSDITDLGIQLCLDYFKPVYRDSSKSEKVAYLLQF